MPLRPLDIDVDDFKFLLDLVVDGVTMRFSTDTFTIFDNTIGVVPKVYRNGLQTPVVDWQLSNLQARSTTIKVVSDVAWFDLLATLEGAKCVLREWVPGTDFKTSRIVLIGIATGCALTLETGSQRLTNVLTFSLQSLPWLDNVTLPPIHNIVLSRWSNGVLNTAPTWPLSPSQHTGAYAAKVYAIDSNITGQFYPIIFGRPRASPALLVEFDSDFVGNEDCWLLVAGHRVQASYVLITDMTAGVSDLCTIFHTKDNQGTTVALAKNNSWFGDTGVRFQQGHAYFADWTVEDSDIGLLDNDKPIRGLGDVLLWLLRQSNLPVDEGRCKVASTFLNKFLIDAYINDQTGIMDWISTHIAAVFPVVLGQSESGWYFTELRWDASMNDVQWRLEVGTILQRQPDVKNTDVNDVYNRIVLTYELFANATNNNSLAQTDTLDTGDTSLATQSQSMQWQARTKTITSYVIVDAGTAFQVMQYLLKSCAYPHKELVLVGSHRFGNIGVGDDILLTDASLSSEPLLVKVVEVKHDIAIVTLVVWTAEPRRMLRQL